MRMFAQDRAFTAGVRVDETDDPVALARLKALEGIDLMRGRFPLEPVPCRQTSGGVGFGRTVATPRLDAG